MSSKFVPLTEDFFVAPQLSANDIEAAAGAGFKLIINNRPDGEAPDQPAGAAINAAASALGLSYAAIPIGGRGIAPADLDALEAAINGAGGPALAFCRSGMRSAALWAYAQARRGRSPDAIIADAAAAGYDITGARADLAALAQASAGSQ